MRKLVFITLFFALVACHQPPTTTATVNDTALNLPGDQVAVDTSTREVNEGPDEEEMGADEERRNQLKNKTEDPSYREKDLVAKQYMLDEDEDLALRWAADTINHIDCAIYVTGGHLPMEDSVAPRNLEEVVKKIGDQQLLVLVNNKQVNIRKGIIAQEDVARMSPAAIGTFIYKNKPYLLIKSYTFSWITSGNGYVSLLVDVRSGQVWVYETYGQVLFKQLIDSIGHS